MKKLLVLLLFSFIIGCASTENIISDYDETVDFNKYSTFVICIDDLFVENTTFPKYDNNKIRSFIGQWPSWLGVDFSQDKNSQKHFKLTNGCEVKAVATSKDALRGFTPTILVFDEAAFIDADSDFWAACMASLSTGGKVIVVSTPNGFDPIYYEIYDQANRSMNEFKISEIRLAEAVIMIWA